MSSFKTVTTACNLVCLQNSHDPIPLPDGEDVIIGRSPLTKIIDPRCSRNQVSIKADWTKREAQVTQIGVNNSSVDGNDIGKNSKVCLKTSNTIFIVAGAFPHRINFKTSSKKLGLDSPSNIQSPEFASKRKLYDKSSHNADVKRVKTESVKNSVSDRQKDHNLNGTQNKTSKSDSGDRKQDRKKDNNLENVSLEKPNKSDESEEDLDKKSTKLAQLKEKASKEKASRSSTGSDAKHKNKSTSSLSHQGVKHEKIASLQSSSSLSSSASTSSSQACVKSEWTSHDHLLVYTSKGVIPHRRIAAFDMDGTLILTASGKVFPTDKDDWKIFHPGVFGKIKNLAAKGFKIVIFTNQLGVAKGKTNVDDLKTKIENVVRKLQVPIQVFVATHEGKYRKPCDGMWDKLAQTYNGGKKIDLNESLYVGDAAGREKDWVPKKKKDFSCSDRLFALNVGVKFFTPEEYFLEQTPTQKFTLPSFDPRKLSSDQDAVPSGTFSNKTKEIIVLVGFPASGKSHFASEVVQPKGYKIVSRDELGSWQKCVQKAVQLLKEECRGVAIDNTNLTVEERSRYIKVAKDAKVSCRCFVLNTSVEHCRHNERFRQISGSSHAKINEMIFNKMKSSYKQPSDKEDFSEVVQVNFVPKFSSPSIEAKYKKFLMEK